jgi:hypothetical protein
MAGMESAKNQLNALVEEAKQIQAKPEVEGECPDGNCEEAPVK